MTDDDVGHAKTAASREPTPTVKGVATGEAIDSARSATIAAVPLTEPPSLAAGARIVSRTAHAERYKYVREIARGGMGRIVEAFDLDLGREIAIKENLIDDPGLVCRFEREALITARLQHPAIVPIYEAGKLPGGDPYYTMRFLRGRSLESAIAEIKSVRERLELLGHMTAAADAMAYAHSRSIIHRDLKPLNVLVGEFGETVVIDWGLAKDMTTRSEEPDLPVGPYRSSKPGETAAGTIFGTPAYMPPEQARGEVVDQRADVYALGAMLHHVLAGEPPFGGRTAEQTLVKVLNEPPRALPPEVSDDLRAIVLKAMARRPTDRYPSAKELAEDLKRWTSGRLVGAHQYSMSQLANRWIKRAWLPLALTTVLAIAVLVGWIWIGRERSARQAAESQRDVLQRENAKLWQERAAPLP